MKRKIDYTKIIDSASYLLNRGRIIDGGFAYCTAVYVGDIIKIIRDSEKDSPLGQRNRLKLSRLETRVKKEIKRQNEIPF